MAALGGAIAACSPSAADPLDRPLEAWEADTPARITFPPVGLEEFTYELQQPAHVELVLHIDEQGALQRVAAERVRGLEPTQVDALLATIRLARFAPAMHQGQPVASIKRVIVDFDPLAGYPVDDTGSTTGRR